MHAWLDKDYSLSGMILANTTYVYMSWINDLINREAYSCGYEAAQEAYCPAH